jgi:hypothetical protein
MWPFSETSSSSCENDHLIQYQLVRLKRPPGAIKSLRFIIRCEEIPPMWFACALTARSAPLNAWRKP